MYYPCSNPYPEHGQERHRSPTVSCSRKQKGLAFHACFKHLSFQPSTITRIRGVFLPMAITIHPIITKKLKSSEAGGVRGTDLVRAVDGYMDGWIDGWMERSDAVADKLMPPYRMSSSNMVDAVQRIFKFSWWCLLKRAFRAHHKSTIRYPACHRMAWSILSRHNSCHLWLKCVAGCISSTSQPQSHCTWGNRVISNWLSLAGSPPG